MFHSIRKLTYTFTGGLARPAWAVTLTILAVEFLDELVFGIEGAVLPAIRDELALSYAQVGLLLSLPKLVGNVVEPALGILGDTGKRKAIVAGGGLMFALALALTATARTFPALLIAFSIFNPASGAFVSLSQATLMDLFPARREQMMARWTLAGSLGVAIGPILVSAALAVMLGWRALYAGMVVAALALVWLRWRQPRVDHGRAEKPAGFAEGIRHALRMLRQRRIWRWLVLLESADLMLDVFLGFIALYFVDVARLSEAQAALAIGVWSAASLVGDALIIPLLERVQGLKYLRWSALVTLALYVLFLAAPDATLKIALLACVALTTSGWYTILQAQYYASLPGRSGIAMSISSASGAIAWTIPWALGMIAGRFGLPWAMALLALGPISLMVGLPNQHVAHADIP